jgi:hypothetical protein
MKYIIAFIFSLVFLFSSCLKSEKEILFQKNDCYLSKLRKLVTDTLYTSVYSQFLDSFEVLRKNEKILQFRDYEIDQAVFFNKARNKCILLILQRTTGKDIFGFGRAVMVVKNDKGWRFSLSKEYIIEGDYFEIFNNNSFDNISKVARYCIMIDGKVEIQACEIDEYYWFEYDAMQ